MNQIDLTEYIPYFLLAIGLTLIAFACFFVSKNSKLKENGVLVDGIVFQQGRDNVSNLSSGDFDNNNVNDMVIIRFVTKEQEWITAPINQDFKIFFTGQYKDGETVKVFYNPTKPSEFYVDTKQSELATRIIGGVTGLCMIIISLYMFFS